MLLNPSVSFHISISVVKMRTKLLCAVDAMRWYKSRMTRVKLAYHCRVPVSMMIVKSFIFFRRGRQAQVLGENLLPHSATG